MENSFAYTANGLAITWILAIIGLSRMDSVKSRVAILAAYPPDNDPRTALVAIER